MLIQRKTPLANLNFSYWPMYPVERRFIYADDAFLNSLEDLLNYWRTYWEAHKIKIVKILDGGFYNQRRVRGSWKKSLHFWGKAVDIFGIEYKKILPEGEEEQTHRRMVAERPFPEIFSTLLNFAQQKGFSETLGPLHPNKWIRSEHQDHLHIGKR